MVNKGFITGYSESSAKKTELCEQPEKAEGTDFVP